MELISVDFIEVGFNLIEGFFFISWMITLSFNFWLLSADIEGLSAMASSWIEF